MAFLLDTNVVSELRKPRPHGAVLAWLQSTNDADLHLASVTLGEIQAGIEIERWLDQLSGSFNLLPMDGAAFRCWAQLMHRRSDTLYEVGPAGRPERRRQPQPEAAGPGWFEATPRTGSSGGGSVPCCGLLAVMTHQHRQKPWAGLRRGHIHPHLG